MIAVPLCEPTIGEIARRLGEPIHRIEYIIRARGIAPSRIAGAYRLFSEQAVEQIASELKAVNAKRMRGASGA